MYKGQHCETFNKYNILPFNGNKIITISGGDMLLTQDKKDRDKAMFWLHNPEKMYYLKSMKKLV